MALLGKDHDIDGKHVSLSLKKKRGIVMGAEAVASSARLTNTTRRMSLTKLGLSMIPASASKMDERRSPSKSVETSGSSQYPRNPFIFPSDKDLMWAQISS
jgi:hypothetical protein